MKTSSDAQIGIRSSINSTNGDRGKANEGERHRSAGEDPEDGEQHAEHDQRPGSKVREHRRVTPVRER